MSLTFIASYSTYFLFNRVFFLAAKKPSVAAIDSIALGGGLELAMVLIPFSL